MSTRLSVLLELQNTMTLQRNKAHHRLIWNMRNLLSDPRVLL